MKKDTKIIKDFISVAKGEKEADIILKNGIIFNTLSGEIYSTDVAIYKGIIVGVGSYNNAIKIIDVKGKFIVPGLIDGHVHIESSMVGFHEFVKAILSHGITTVIADPHEIANVCGIKGIEYFLKESEDLPINFYVMLPSCVPATNLETSGSIISEKDYKDLLKYKNVIGLAEMMNYPGVIQKDEDTLKKLSLFSDRLIDGHAPQVNGKDLCAYIVAGVTSEHECVTAREALEKLRLGMYIMLREGSATKNLLDLLPFVNKFNSPHCFLATDDRHPDDIVDIGSIDYMVRSIIKETGNAMRAIRMATLYAAKYYNLRDLGAIAPGYRADLIVVNNLEDFNIKTVLKSGNVVYDHGEIIWKSNRSDESLREKYPALFSTIRIGDIEPSKFNVYNKGGKIRVIEVIPDQIITNCVIVQPKIEDNKIVSDVENDILKLVVIERHHKTGNVGIGFVKGFGLKGGALATTISHDSHNIVIVSTRDDYILKAVDLILENDGGIVFVNDKEEFLIPLPIAGLMGMNTMDNMAIQLKKLKLKLRNNGCKLNDALMHLSFLALPVIPSLKLTDRGLVDVKKFEFVSLFVGE